MSDKELLEKFSNPTSRNDAFNVLIKTYQQRVYWHIRKMVIDHDDANDLTQETFIKAWKGLDSFKGDSQLFTWLYRIATNECLSFLGRKKRRFFLPNYDLSEDLANKLDDSSTISGEEIQLKLQKALLSLPDKQRLVFNMKDFDDMKYEEISEITGTSVGGLKSSYHLAIKKIEEFLSNQEDFGL